jgi:alanyl-tRNA synthetase
VTKGYKAGELVSVASKVLGGGGGGKPELAQGGGTNVEKLSQAIAAAAAMV